MGSNHKSFGYKEQKSQKLGTRKIRSWSWSLSVLSDTWSLSRLFLTIRSALLLQPALDFSNRTRPHTAPSNSLYIMYIRTGYLWHPLMTGLMLISQFQTFQRGIWLVHIVIWTRPQVSVHCWPMDQISCVSYLAVVQLLEAMKCKVTCFDAHWGGTKKEDSWGNWCGQGNRYP